MVEKIRADTGITTTTAATETATTAGIDKQSLNMTPFVLYKNNVG